MIAGALLAACLLVRAAHAGQICFVGANLNASLDSNVVACTAVPHAEANGYVHTTWSCPTTLAGLTSGEAHFPNDFTGKITNVTSAWTTASVDPTKAICNEFGITVDGPGTNDPPGTSITGAEQMALGPIVRPTTSANTTLYGSGLLGPYIPQDESGLACAHDGLPGLDCRNKHFVFSYGRTSVLCTGSDPLAGELIGGCFYY
jgi:hypothetical protein